MKETQNKAHWLWCAVTFGYLAVLTYALLAENPFRMAGASEEEARKVFHDYVAPISHLLTFFAAGLLCALAFSRTSRLTIVAALVSYAFATEAIQYLVPGRTPDWADIVQDLVGLSLGTGLGWLLRRKDQAPTPPDGATRLASQATAHSRNS